MKKLLTIAFVLGSMVFTVPFAQAADKTANALTTETLQQRRGQSRNSRYDRDQDRRQNRRYDRDQDRRQNRRYDRGNNSRVRTFYQTRNVRRGRYYYRETYRVRVLPNGRRQVTFVNRVRLDRRY